ncbi:MAG TPA: hypothetical protein PKI81_12080, partial [bacterium]|nr:hypothetical protein [bacterium]
SRLAPGGYEMAWRLWRPRGREAEATRTGSIPGGHEMEPAGPGWVRDGVEAVAAPWREPEATRTGWIPGGHEMEPAGQERAVSAGWPRVGARVASRE